MSNVNTVVTYRGRSLGIIVLTLAQLLVGVMHVFFGLWLLIAGSLADSAISAQSPLFYSVYTLVFGLLTLVFYRWNLVEHKLGLDWHFCGFHVCYRRGCLDTFEFTKHPWNSTIGGGSRDYLQSSGLAVFVSNSC